MNKRALLVAIVVAVIGSGLAIAGPRAGDPGPARSSASEPAPEPASTPPGHQETPGKKKGCGKGKGKKKGCHKNIKGSVVTPVDLQPKPCSSYKPGEMGAGAPSIKLTDANGYFSRKTIVFDQPGGVKLGVDEIDGETGGDSYFNIQVEPAAERTGLWARLEFAERRDYDLILFDRKGNEVASSKGFNVVHDETDILSPDSPGGESSNASETLRGIRSSRCAGYTLNVSSAAAEGGELTLHLWLGPIGFTPGKAG